MYKRIFGITIIFIILLILPPPAYSVSDYVETTIWLPDNYGGVVYPQAGTYNPHNNRIYVCGGTRITVI
ncbi:MAG: hypothetical protein WBD28_11180, partial [Candidatus Zixiibacteriota bacterium]